MEEAKTEVEKRVEREDGQMDVKDDNDNRVEKGQGGDHSIEEAVHAPTKRSQQVTRFGFQTGDHRQ